LTQKDVFGSYKGNKKSSGRSKVAAKYHDLLSGQTCVGDVNRRSGLMVNKNLNFLLPNFRKQDKK